MYVQSGEIACTITSVCKCKYVTVDVNVCDCRRNDVSQVAQMCLVTQMCDCGCKLVSRVTSCNCSCTFTKELEPFQYLGQQEVQIVDLHCALYYIMSATLPEQPFS